MSGSVAITGRIGGEDVGGGRGCGVEAHIPVPGRSSLWDVGLGCAPNLLEKNFPVYPEIKAKGTGATECPLCIRNHASKLLDPFMT